MERISCHPTAVDYLNSRLDDLKIEIENQKEKILRSKFPIAFRILDDIDRIESEKIQQWHKENPPEKRFSESIFLQAKNSKISSILCKKS